jgi:hypothetical protein
MTDAPVLSALLPAIILRFLGVAGPFWGGEIEHRVAWSTIRTDTPVILFALIGCCRATGSIEGRRITAPLAKRLL